MSTDTPEVNTFLTASDPYIYANTIEYLKSFARSTYVRESSFGNVSGGFYLDHEATQLVETHLTKRMIALSDSVPRDVRQGLNKILGNGGRIN